WPDGTRPARRRSSRDGPRATHRCRSVPIASTLVSVEQDGCEPWASCAMTVVIFLLIVLMWAVVLIPMWLRRHDEVEESRSLDRFSTAMHTLSRRDPESPDKK